MTWDDILTYIRQPESQTMRFFKKDPDPESLLKVMVAMANADGGTILVGLDHKNLHFFGTGITESVLCSMVTQYCRDQFEIGCTTVSRNDKVLLAIHVQESLYKPVFFRDACYVYIGTESQFFIAEDPFAEPTEKRGYTNPEGGLSWSEVPSQKGQPVISEALSVSPMTDQSRSVTEAPQQVWSQPLFDTLSDRQRRLLSVLQTSTAVRNQVYREMFGISHKTAHIELTDLVNKGLLVQEGAGRSTRYVLPAEKGNVE